MKTGRWGAMRRRRFLELAVGGTVASLGDLRFLSRLGPVYAADARLDSRTVRFHAAIESSVRLLEDTPRERVLEEVGARIRRGLSYREVVAALLLAGVRNIQPRPGRLQVPRGARRELGASGESRVARTQTAGCRSSGPSISSRARRPRTCAQATGRSARSTKLPFRPATGRARPSSTPWMPGTKPRPTWRSRASPARPARTRCSRSSHATDARDFREIGHKAIYVANSFRTLEVDWLAPCRAGAAVARLRPAGPRRRQRKPRPSRSSRRSSVPGEPARRY